MHQLPQPIRDSKGGKRWAKVTNALSAERSGKEPTVKPARERKKRKNPESEYCMIFSKYHALGNDYIVINPADIHSELTPDHIQKICHRNFGIGSDGILLGPIEQKQLTLPYKFLTLTGVRLKRAATDCGFFPGISGIRVWFAGTGSRFIRPVGSSSPGSRKKAAAQPLRWARSASAANKYRWMGSRGR